MKFLIYELFSGVGLCNQIFSLETAIYLANISNRKLLLLVKNPLCHCGKASWDYGYLLNYFTNDFLEYLPHGFEVFYKTFPDKIDKICRDGLRTRRFKYAGRFSEIVFVDKNLDLKKNQIEIEQFLHYRKKEYLQFDENKNFEFFYINQSNASRCFSNFYTTKNNYTLMNNIAKSLKFKPFFYDLANEIYLNIHNKDLRNNFAIFLHLRFGDRHKNKDFLERFNKQMIKNISEFIDGHHTNLIKPKIYALVDNKNNKDFFDVMKKFNIEFVDKFTDGVVKRFLNKNSMLFYDFFECKDYDVATAIIEMILCSKSNEFIGTVTSTFSNYIQYLRYINYKSYYNYSNLEFKNVKHCKLQPINNSPISWIRYGFKGGHPISWHMFWDPNLRTNKTLYTIHGKTDGFGSQLQAIFSLIAYCNYTGYSYIHTPMYAMQHNDEKVKDFPQIMNKFINLEHKFKTINNISNYENSILHKVKEGAFVHGSLRPEYFYTEGVLNLFRECYYSTEKPKVDCYDPSKKHIAIHIRRGDVNSQNYPSRYTNDKEYLQLLDKMNINLDSTKLHIFSEGKKEDFKIYTDKYKDAIVFHLNENIQLTFHSMVIADTLILSKSSFSYCCGLLNKNTIIANLITKWWHKPLKNWKIY